MTCNSISDFYNLQRSGIPYYGQHNIELHALQSVEHAKRFEDLRIVSTDIEVDSPDEFPYPEFAKYPVTCIAMVSKDEIVVFSLDPWEASKSMHKDVRYIHCKTERDLLERFINFWKANPPHIVTGWYTDSFDLPYLVNRINKILPGRSIELSPFFNIRDRTIKNKFGREIAIKDIMGVESLDLLRMYEKFVFESVPTHKLEYIASFDLGDGKLSFTGTHSEFRASDPQRYVDYCIQDAVLVLRINDKRQLLQIACHIAWLARMNLSNCYSPVRTWDAILCNNMRADNVFPLVIPDPPPLEEFLGAYVKEPIPGLYDWALSFDVNSLYPTLIRQFNMCATTIDQSSYSFPTCIGLPVDDRAAVVTEQVKNFDLEIQEGFATAINTVKFATGRKAYMAEAATSLFKDRVTAQATMLELLKLGKDTEASSYKTLQEAIKVTLNSLYGACANRYFRFYDIRIAESITSTGRYIIQSLQKDLNEFLGFDAVIASDTDSLYIHLGAKANSIEDVRAIEVDIDKFLKAQCQKIARKFNCTESLINLKREAIARRGLWTAKKRYALDVLDMKGVIKNEIKTTGLEVSQGSSSVTTKRIMKEALELILRGAGDNRIADRLELWYDEFKDLPVQEIAAVKKVGDMAKWVNDDGTYAKGMHTNVRAALAYNKFVGRVAIRDDDKVFMVKLIQPNPVDSEIVAIPLDAPNKVLKSIEPYIDRGAMFVLLIEATIGRLTDAAKIPIYGNLASGLDLM